MNDPDARKIRFRGQELGPYSVDKLYRMRMGKQIDGTTEFYSPSKDQWLPLAGIIEDLETTVTTERRLQQMKEAGFETVKFLVSGEKGDCPSCRALAKTAHPIDNVPKIPPADCTCVPWCRLVLIVDESSL